MDFFFIVPQYLLEFLVILCAKCCLKLSSQAPLFFLFLNNDLSMRILTC